MDKKRENILSAGAVGIGILLTLLLLLLGQKMPLLYLAAFLSLAMNVLQGLLVVYGRRQREQSQEEPIGWRQQDRQLLGLIERMLKGCDNQRSTQIQLPARSPFFFVLGVEIAALRDVASDDTEQFARKEIQVCNVLSQIFAAHSFWPMNIDGLLTCVINLRPDPNRPLETDALQVIMLPKLNEAVERLDEEGISVRFSVSDVVVGVENLSPAYYHVVDVFEQLVFLHPNEDAHIILAEPGKATMPTDHVTRAKTEKLFTNYILAQDFENARLALLKLTEYELQQQEFSVTIKRLTSNRLAWSLDALGCYLPPETTAQLRKRLEAIGEVNYIQELTGCIGAWFDILAAGTKAPAGDSLIPRVREYIQENCLDSQLSVSAISEHFSVNASYLSNSFHSQTGIRLIDFIHQQRLKKVKQLLRETELSVAQIAECTGYYSAVSMSRAFKRYEGITPSAYRNS